MNTTKSAFPISPGFVLISSAFFGGYSTLSQVLIFREELVLFEGNELVLSSLLAWWLLGLAMGALLPKFIPIGKRPVLIFTVLFLAAPLLLLGCLTFTRLFPLLFSIPAENIADPCYLLLIPLIGIFPMSFLFGFSFPLLSVTLHQSYAHYHSRQSYRSAFFIGTIFTYEALGSVIGGLMLVLVLIPRFTGYEVGMFMLCSSLILLVVMYTHHSILMYLFGGGILLSLLLIQNHFPEWLDKQTGALQWNYRHPGHELIYHEETPYQRLEVGNRHEQITVFGNGVPLFSFPNAYEFTHWGHMALSQSPSAKSILLVGSSGYELIDALAEHNPVRIDCVELDPAIQNLVHHLPYWEHRTEDKPWIKYHYTDPRAYLSSLPESRQFDVIAVNQPDPVNGLTNRLYTKTFYQLAKQHLKPTGVLTFTITGTPNYLQGDVGNYGATLFHTLKTVFDRVLVLPGTNWWYFASPSRPLSSDPDVIAERFKQANVETNTFSPAMFSMYYDPQRIDRARTTLAEQKGISINQDNAPICYLYSLLLWAKQYGFFKHFNPKQITTAIVFQSCLILGILSLFFAIPFLVMIPFTGKKGISILLPFYLLAATGFIGMGVEIVILMVYQMQVGNLYHHVGIFFGLFMAGLAMGSQQSVQSMQNPDRSVATTLIYTLGGFAGCLFFTPILFEGLTMFFVSIPLIEIILFCWICVLAYGIGAIFPLAAALMESQARDVPFIATYSILADNLGGAIGALFTGVLLIPILGLLQTVYFFLVLLVVFLIWLFVAHYRSSL